VSDILRMYENCTTYNGAESVFAKYANRQLRDFLKFSKKFAVV
jgi:hypothetical protein